MSKFENTLAKFLDIKTVVTFKELSYLLGQLGYDKKKTGKTSGSRVAFINYNLKSIIRLHKPHPGNELKEYVKKEIVNELLNKKLI